MLSFNVKTKIAVVFNISVHLCVISEKKVSDNISQFSLCDLLVFDGTLLYCVEYLWCSGNFLPLLELTDNSSVAPGDSSLWLRSKVH